MKYNRQIGIVRVPHFILAIALITQLGCEFDDPGTSSAQQEQDQLGQYDGDSNSVMGYVPSRVLEGFSTAHGETVSFIVVEDDGHNGQEELDIVVRTKYASGTISVVAPLAMSYSPLELWSAFQTEAPPDVLYDHHASLADIGLVQANPRHISEEEKSPSVGYVSEDVDGGEGNCSNFASAYTWSDKYVSRVVTAGVTANLSSMERFRTGACNRASNASNETIRVNLDRWTSAISGWNPLLSETIVRGESVEYIRSLNNCSYYRHRLRTNPSSNTTFYRYAGQWADVTCPDLEIGRNFVESEPPFGSTSSNLSVDP